MFESNDIILCRACRNLNLRAESFIESGWRYPTTLEYETVLDFVNERFSDWLVKRAPSRGFMVSANIGRYWATVVVLTCSVLLMGLFPLLMRLARDFLFSSFEESLGGGPP